MQFPIIDFLTLSEKVFLFDIVCVWWSSLDQTFTPRNLTDFFQDLYLDLEADIELFADSGADFWHR